jgi:hypothetical protein
MVLVLNRTYFPEGTQGILAWNGTVVCYTIELPWLDNQRRVSCIPEGEYVLQQRFSPKFGWHLHLKNVPGRALILIHPANDATKELLGCIAPVTIPTAIGKGSGSRKAFEKLRALVYHFLETKREVLLTIQSQPENPKRINRIKNMKL